MIHIVISRYNEDISWTKKFGTYPVLIYEKFKQIPVNKGKEASAYLKYILDHYENLPERIFFIHCDEYSWHHEGSIVQRFLGALHSQKDFFSVNKYGLGTLKSNPDYEAILTWYTQYIHPWCPMPLTRDWTAGHGTAGAQFLVNRRSILKWPKEMYQGLYDWILEHDKAEFLEWTWHVLWDPEFDDTPRDPGKLMWLKI